MSSFVEFIAQYSHLFLVFYIILSFAVMGTGLLVFRRGVKRLSNIFFFCAAAAIGVWGVVFGLYSEGLAFTGSSSFDLMLPYLVGANIPITLLFFSLTFTQQKLRIGKKRITLILFPYTVLVWWMYFLSSRIVEFTAEGNIVVSKTFYMFYVLYAVGYGLVAFFILLQRYQVSAGVFKAAVRSIVLGAGAAFLVTLWIAVLYVLEKDQIVVLLGYLFGAGTFLYVAVKKVQYHRWAVKPFLTELFVYFIDLVLIAQMFFVESTNEAWLNTFVLVFFSVSGFFLIRGVARESKAKDEIEKLVKDLAEANDELQELDKRKSEFVKISAHHLKTPLTVIKGYASMILEGSFGKEMDKDAEDAVRKIFDASERLVNIIKDFMDISNIESGKMEYAFDEVDLKKLVEGVLEEMKMTIEKSGLDVSFNTDEIDGYTLKADAGKLRQVVSNLTDNAIKYTPHGHVHLFLKKDKKEGKLLLTITDTGVGMSEETINKLFEKFSRADDANKVNTGGSGLGLYVAKEIMKKHEANIWVESPGEGKGSTFHLEFESK